MRALDRTVSILEAVAQTHGAARPIDVAETAGLSLSTVARLMRDLTAHGLLDRLVDGNYVVGPRLLAIAQSASERTPFLAAAMPAMERLRDATGETVSLHIEAGDRRVCLAEVQSRQPVRRVVPMGLSLPMHVGATGQVILAHLAPASRDAYIDRIALPDGERVRLVDRLNQIRDAGWALAVDGFLEGISGLAAPIIVPGLPVACLSVSGPSARWTEEAMLAHVDDTVAAATYVATHTLAQ